MKTKVLLADCWLLVVTIAYLSTSWQHVTRATLLVATAAIVRFAWHRSRRDVVVYLFGFVFASVAEIVQVRAGLYTYAQASPLVIPIYNFFLWGAVLLAASSLLTAMERSSSAALRPSLSELVSETIVYLAMTLVLCVGGHHSELIATLFATLLVVRLGYFYRADDWRFVIVGVLAGPLVEGWLVHCGIYHFAKPAIGNLPLWHPLYWGLIVLYLRRMARAADLFFERGVDGDAQLF